MYLDYVILVCLLSHRIQKFREDLMDGAGFPERPYVNPTTTLSIPTQPLLQPPINPRFMTQPEDEWELLSLNLANDPDSFEHWEKLVKFVTKGLNKASTSTQLERFRLTYDQLLLKYPFLEQYWVNYAELEFKLGNTDLAQRVYQRALSIVPCSKLIWIKYLDFLQLVVLSYDKMLVFFQQAEMHIGTDFYSYEFWKKYMQFEESHNGRSVFWFNILKKVLTIPLYNFAYFFNILFDEIEKVREPESLLKIVDTSELQKRLKMDADFANWTKEAYHDARAKLKKTYTDAYITTQFKSFELYQYEKKITLEYYVPMLYKSYQDLATWDQYTTFMELNGTPKQITQLYHRALVPTANYPNIWLKFADYYIKLNKLQSAKSLLYKSLLFMSDANLVPVQLKLIKIELALDDYIRARDLVMASLSKNADNVELLLLLINVEYQLMIRRGEDCTTEEFVEFVLALVKGKTPDLCVSILRHLSGFKSFNVDMVKVLQGLKDELKGSVQYWLLLLTNSSQKDRHAVYQEALNIIGEDQTLVKWDADNLSYTDTPETLSQQFKRLSALMLQ